MSDVLLNRECETHQLMMAGSSANTDAMEGNTIHVFGAATLPMLLQNLNFFGASKENTAWRPTRAYVVLIVTVTKCPNTNQSRYDTQTFFLRAK